MMQSTRRTFLRSTAMAGTFATFGIGTTQAATDDGESVSFSEDFSNYGGDWYLGQDLYGTQGDWDVSIVEPASMSTPAVRFITDASAATGMTWVYKEIPIEPGVEYEGTVSARMWSSGETEYPLTNICMYMGPSNPQTADDFPTPREAWFYEGPETGLYQSLWQSAGWNDYTAHWATPAFDTDTLYLAVGVQSEYAGQYAHYLDSVDVSLEPTDGSGGQTPTVQSVSVTETNTSFMGERTVSFDDTNRTITVDGYIDLPSACHSPVVLDSTYDASADELAITLGTEDTADPGEACTQMVETTTYQVTAVCDGGLPGSVSVSTPDGTSVSAANAPTLTDAELTLDGPTTADPRALFDETTESVTIQDTVALRDGCDSVELAAVDFDAATDTLTVDVDRLDPEENCTQQYTEQPITVTASFDGGLPGTVDYLDPEA